MYLLSICIPTFNREKNLRKMLSSIKFTSKVEVVVCDDGSTDKTRNLLKNYSNKSNFKYIYQKNSGVSAAMVTAYKHATGKYVIKMDSDDLFTNNGLDFILETIKNNPEQVAFLYGVKTIKKKVYSKNLPPNAVVNFISVRADYKIKGDLKEVVKRKIVLEYMYKVPKGVKRIPPGLLWAKIGENYNCLSFKKAVAIKNYLHDGITSKMLHMKTNYSNGMVELYKFLSDSKAYNSIFYRWRSRLLWARYSFHNHSIRIKNCWQLFVFMPGVCIYIIDKIKLFKKN
jgi:glycosyltransferase involved in cell wall biosynthesis